MKRRLCLTWLQGVIVLLSLLGHYLVKTTQLPAEKCASAIQIPCELLFKTKKANCYMTNMTCVPDNLPNDLSSLCLSRNKIKYLYNNAFERYTKLHDLDLSQNDIRFVATGTFYPLKNLRTLELKNNFNLKSISAELFKSSYNLSSLSLWNCGIASLPHDIFRWLPQLQFMSLGKNHISSLNITLCPNRTIETMELSENMIYRLTNRTFIFPCKCGTLELHRMPIHTLESKVIESLATRSLSTGSETGVHLKDLEQVYKELFKGVSLSKYIDSLVTTYFDVRAISTFSDLGHKSLSELYLFHFVLSSRD